MIIPRYAVIAVLSFGAIVSSSQYAHAQSQTEMNQQSARDFEEADKALNDTYNRLVSKIDKESQAKLKAAQKAWIAFRDAEANMIADFDARGGSMAPMIYNGRRAELTKERAKQLMQIMKEHAE